jgi:RHS repeat-associated protein
MNKTLRIFTLLLTIVYFFSSTIAPVLAAVTYSYDQNGNMTADGTECFEYNEANQLKKVKNCGNNQTIAEYVYDYNGTRVIKKVYQNGALQKTVYSPSDDFETVKLASNGATQNTSYYIVNNELVAKKNPDGSKNYYHNDHLGSTSVLTNQAGALVEETTYDPWGEVKSGGTKSKFQYTGQEKDAETGLNYYNFRYYDPHIRRFTQPDDIIQDPYNPQDLNQYAYVRNNPLRYTDPTGHSPAALASVFAGATVIGFSMVGVEFVTNPNATDQDYANAYLQGYSFTLGAAFMAYASRGMTTSLIAKTALPALAAQHPVIQPLVKQTPLAMGFLGGAVTSNALFNIATQKPALGNLTINLAADVITNKVGGGLGEKLFKVGKGRPAEKTASAIMTSQLNHNRQQQVKRDVFKDVLDATGKFLESVFEKFTQPEKKKR